MRDLNAAFRGRYGASAAVESVHETNAGESVGATRGSAEAAHAAEVSRQPGRPVRLSQL
jgi:hypothetical protein